MWCGEDSLYSERGECLHSSPVRHTLWSQRYFSHHVVHDPLIQPSVSVVVSDTHTNNAYLSLCVAEEEHGALKMRNQTENSPNPVLNPPRLTYRTRLHPPPASERKPRRVCDVHFHSDSFVCSLTVSSSCKTDHRMCPVWSGSVQKTHGASARRDGGALVREEGESPRADVPQ